MHWRQNTPFCIIWSRLNSVSGTVNEVNTIYCRVLQVISRSIPTFHPPVWVVERLRSSLGWDPALFRTYIELVKVSNSKVPLSPLFGCVQSPSSFEFRVLVGHYHGTYPRSFSRLLCLWYLPILGRIALQRCIWPWTTCNFWYSTNLAMLLTWTLLHRPYWPSPIEILRNLGFLTLIQIRWLHRISETNSALYKPKAIRKKISSDFKDKHL